ncbi:hypothetical protein EDB87DRAFT_627171 [Lactarius vividus]|nr:hypothetical protein EDB87DRAFT_627171 [Lactarius vividus]
MEHQQMILNSPDQDHSRSETPGTSPQIAQSQGIPSQRRVQVTVLRGHNVPKISKRFRLKNQYFVTVTDQATTKKTASVSIKGQTVQWDQTFDAFSVQPSSRLKFCLYAKRMAHPDTLIGMHESPIPAESQIDIPFTLSNGDGEGGQSDQPVILYLTIAVSTNATSHPVSPINPASAVATKADVSPIERATKPTIIHDSTKSVPFVFATAPEPPSPTDHTPTGTNTPMPTVPDIRATVSPAENALRVADEAAKAINLSSTWEGAVARIKWVVDTVSPVAELHPYAKMACGLLLAIPKTLLEQFQSDGNVRTLLVAMYDAFDFANQEDILKYIKRESKQAQILTLMLQHVCNCGDFIQSYTKDPQFCALSSPTSLADVNTRFSGRRTLVNLGSRVDNQIEDLRITLIELRKAFLDQAAITTEITALQILDDVGIISANVGRISSQLDGVATQLKWVSSQVSDAELDAKIREIPYGTGSRFMPEKGCLLGTRTDFLDFVVDWVNSPDSDRSLVLFGQGGTGKSSIAHEIARRFDKMHRLTSSFIFLRKEQSKREAYRFFTTLAHDLSDRYPSFKAALGRIVKNDSSLRFRTRDYPTLFESLILKPLEDLHIIGPILVVIDALDESGDATGRNGLHTFLAKNISRLPSNFRVLITSRPEGGILSAFDGAPSVRIKYMNDSELAARTDDDILTYLRGLLPSDEFEMHGAALTRKAEGLFQWAAVAGKFILDPPECFALSKRECINHLLKHTTDGEGQDPLDELYKEVLEGYITHRKTQLLFRSVVGQLITAFEPLSIGSLITLRGHTSNDNDDADSVVMMLRRLGSLLSNVNSPDGTLPIVPLHTSFRDFLINKEKSGDFSIVLQDAHYGLARSCLDLVLRDLRFNICNIESSYLANKDIQDLEARVSEHLPPPLLYACRFYDGHLQHLGFESRSVWQTPRFLRKETSLLVRGS